MAQQFLALLLSPLQLIEIFRSSLVDHRVKVFHCVWRQIVEARVEASMSTRLHWFRQENELQAVFHYMPIGFQWDWVNRRKTRYLPNHIQKSSFNDFESFDAFEFPVVARKLKYDMGTLERCCD